jgi:hypothetical protein
VISDFREDSHGGPTSGRLNSPPSGTPRGWASPLGALRARHSMLAIEVCDPRESSVPNLGVLAVVDPESGRLVQVNTARRRCASASRRSKASAARRSRGELRRLRVDHVTLSTEGEWLAELGRRLR